MAFNIAILDKSGNEMDWTVLDSEVCRLWQVKPNKGHWCKAPRDSYFDNWHEFLGHCVFLMRAYDNSNRSYTASDFFKGLLVFGGWETSLEFIQNNRYEILLLFFWVSKEYEFRVENRL